MATIDLPALERALNLLPSRFRGPGGVAGVVRDGEIVATRSWGFADMEPPASHDGKNQIADLLDLQAVYLCPASGSL